MNQNDGDNNSNDILNGSDLNNGVSLAGGEENINDMYGNSMKNEASGVLGLLSDEEEDLPHLLREQDRYLPIANVAKLMKKAIPERGKIAKDAKECVQECLSEFVSFITSEAAERCSQEKRKTINGEDILFAMSNLGFDNYVEPLKIFLQKYRDSVKCDTRIAVNEYAGNSEVENNGEHLNNY